MKITIDTKADSKKEIEHLVDFLQTLLQKQSMESSKQEFPTGENVLGSLFGGQDQQLEEENKEDKNSESPFSLQTY